MKIVDFILSKITPRLRQRRLLVVYDPSGRFKPVAEMLAQKQEALYLDASTHLLEALKTTHFALQAGLKQPVVIYVPHPKPETLEQKLKDPFAGFSEIGAQFPATGADDYEQLCLLALPKKEAAIRNVFAHSDPIRGPDFELIEPLFEDGSAKWPSMRALSKRRSEAELLQWLLVSIDDASFKKAASEIRTFAATILGVELTASELESVSAARDKFWSAALMTEFMSVRGESAPAVYETVPVAPIASRDLVIDAVRNLRNNRRTQEKYEKYALQTARMLQLAAHVSPIKVEKTCATFLEEAEALKKAFLEALNSNKASEFQKLFAALSDSFWLQNDDAFLGFAKTALEFNQSLADLDAALAAGPAKLRVKTAVESYCQIGASVDSLARRFALAADDVKSQETKKNGGLSGDDVFDKLCAALFSRYRTLMQREQDGFIAAVQEEGWPAGVSSNAETFADSVAAPLANGARVAFIIVDALRYEAGLLLAKNLQNFALSIKPVCALLPTITAVGKASLLPGAEQLTLSLDNKANALTPKIGDTVLETVDDRMKLLRGLYGDRFKQMKTKDFLSKRPSDFDKTELLVLRYDDLDEMLETETSFMLEAVPHGIQHLSNVVRRLARISKFSDVVIAADHGFGLNLRPGAGDKCAKPAGSWIGIHDRFLLGEGASASDMDNYVMEAGHLGIQGNVRQAAFPRALCSYQAGRQYFHGGLSLAEAVVPVITVHLASSQKPDSSLHAELQLLLIPRKKKFTTLIARLTLKPVASLLEQKYEGSVQILITQKGSKEPAGVVMDNDAGILTMVDDDIDFRVRINSFDEPSRVIQVVALDPKTGVRLAETTFEVEVLQ